MKKTHTDVNINTQQNQKTAELQKQVENLKQELDEYTNRWKRALADYQNLEKRHIEDKAGFIRFAARNFIEKLLPAVDTLEKAYLHLKDHGLELALKEVQFILKAEGVEKIEVLGKDFDVRTMEAVSIVSGKEDHKVIEEVRPGYLMHGSLLRAARVVVSKKKV